MEYTIKIRFKTAKAGRGAGQIIKGGNGECDITTDFSIEELKADTDSLKSIAYESLSANPKVKKMGSIISIDIIDVVAL